MRRTNISIFALQVLIGDPRQLEAHSEFFNTHMPAERGGLAEAMAHHTRSAMERLRQLWQDRGCEALLSVRLRTQYRMHESVCYLIDKNFYSRPGKARLLHLVQIFCLASEGKTG